MYGPEPSSESFGSRWEPRVPKLGTSWAPGPGSSCFGVPLKGSFKGDIDIDTDVEVDVDMDIRVAAKEFNSSYHNMDIYTKYYGFGSMVTEFKILNSNPEGSHVLVLQGLLFWGCLEEASKSVYVQLVV